MRLAPLYLLAALAGVSVFAQGPAGPIVKRPRPTTSSRPSPPPPPRRIGERPVEYERPEPAYIPPTDPVLLKAIEANEEFDQRLPNFLCRQFMTRSRSRNLGKKWKDEDVVEAEVLIADDKEQYRDIKIDGRPTGAKDLSQIGGAWSTGEYSTVVWNLFIPPSHTEFTLEGPDTLGERKTVVYRYEIKQENSRWTLNMNGKDYTPGHHGKVWIEPETGRVIRMEMEATYLPYDFPMSSAASNPVRRHRDRQSVVPVARDGRKHGLRARHGGLRAHQHRLPRLSQVHG
ncbi:MAG: hypothetical protein R2748_24850 [Bryobacterales bacterium]